MGDTPSRTFKNAAYEHLAQLAKALASPARQELLEVLAQAPRHVEALAHEINQSVANTSHHLQVLTRAKLVTRQRQGQQILYSQAGDDVAALMRQLYEVASRHHEGLERLVRERFAPIDERDPIDLDTLLTRLRNDEAVLIDVREAHEFQARHLPGAISAPLALLTSRLDQLPRDRTIIAYCRGPLCTLSAEAVQRLRALGYDAQRAEITAHHTLALEAQT